MFTEGDTAAGIWTVGQTQGLIDDVPTVADLTGRMMREAEELIEQRLAGLLQATQPVG